MEIIVGVVAILSLITIKLINMKICIWKILIGFAILIIAILSMALITIIVIMNKKYEVIEELVKEAYGISDGQA